MTTRVLAWSDLHLDYRDNREHFDAACRRARPGDALILAGDLTDPLPLLDRALARAAAAFEHVVFVPGNHELWSRRGDAPDALSKLDLVLESCARRGVHTSPLQTTCGLWLVPLLSWYEKPEHGVDSLFVRKPGECRGRVVWSDDLFVTWPEMSGRTAAGGLYLVRAVLVTEAGARTTARARITLLK